MTWTNAFDLGTCTVSVEYYDGNPPTELFSGVVGKGGSATFQGPSNEGALTVEVSSDGAVTLSSNDLSLDVNGYGVRVIPATAVSLDSRVSSLSFGTGCTYAYGGITTGTTQGVDYLDFDSVSPATPDPLDMSSLTGPKDWIEVYAANEGV